MDSGYYFMIFRMMLMMIITLAALFDDIRRYKISNRIGLGGMFVALILILYEAISGCNVAKYIIGGGVAFILLFAAYVVLAVGAGDVKLGGVLGLIAGAELIVRILIWAFIYTAIFGVILTACKRSRVIELSIGKVHTVHFSVALAVGEFVAVISMALGGVWVFE